MRRSALFLVVALLAGSCGDAATSNDQERFCELGAEFRKLGLVSVGMTRERAGLVRDLVDEASRVAPEEIRASVETMRDGFVRFLDIFEKADFDVAQVDQAEIDALFADGAISAADTAWTGWINTNCGL